MDSDKVQSSAVMVLVPESVGTGILIQCSAPQFDYIITARHNIEGCHIADINILDCNGVPLELINIEYNEPIGPDIAILRVQKTDQANKIPACLELENHTAGVLAGYPGALQLEINKGLEIRGEISYSATERTDFYFEIFNAPDPAVYKEDYITGFSGGGIFQLSPTKANVVLKGIAIQRWDESFDVKKIRCIKIAVVTKILEEKGLPPFSGIHEDFSRFVEQMPALFSADFADLLKRAAHIKHLAGTNVAEMFSAEGLSLPQLEGLYTRLIKLPFRAQERLLGETLYAKSIAFAYYYPHADKLDFCDNPVLYNDDLKILLCCTQDHMEIPSIVYHLTDESHRDFLDKCLVIVCTFDQNNSKPLYGVDSDRTSAIVRNYTRASVDRQMKAKAASYLQTETPTRGFSVYPISALSPLIDKNLDGLQFEAENDSDYFVDEKFLQVIKETLDGTIKDQQ